MKNEQLSQQLIQAAIIARKSAQAKYSGYKVGAALYEASGEIYTGCNVESSSYGLTICAERVALTKALSEGKSSFTHMAIIGPDDAYCPPCGACRQLLHDYAPNIQIILSDGKEKRIIPLKELLPLAFEEKNLRRI